MNLGDDDAVIAAVSFGSVCCKVEIEAQPRFDRVCCVAADQVPDDDDDDAVAGTRDRSPYLYQ